MIIGQQEKKGMSLEGYSQKSPHESVEKLKVETYQEIITILMPLFEWQDGKGLAIFEWAIEEVSRGGYLKDQAIHTVLQNLVIELTFSSRLQQEGLVLEKAVKIPTTFNINELQYFAQFYKEASAMVFQSAKFNHKNGGRIMLSFSTIKDLEDILILYSRQVRLEIQYLLEKAPTEMLETLLTKHEKQIKLKISTLIDELNTLSQNITQKSVTLGFELLKKLNEILSENEFHPKSTLFLKAQQAANQFLKAVQSKHKEKNFKYLKEVIKQESNQPNIVTSTEYSYNPETETTAVSITLKNKNALHALQNTGMDSWGWSIRRPGLTEVSFSGTVPALNGGEEVVITRNIKGLKQDAEVTFWLYGQVPKTLKRQK